MRRQVQLTDVLVVGVQYRYAWKEQIQDSVTGLYVDMAGGRYGTVTENYAVEVNDQPVSVPRYALIRERGVSQNQLLFEFEASDSFALPWKAVVRAATVVPLPANTYNNGDAGVGATLTGVSNGALPAIDGVTLVVGDRLLNKGGYSGVYNVTQLGDSTHPYVLTRSPDSDTGALLLGLTVRVMEGTTNGGTMWTCLTHAPIVPAVTPLVWQLIGYGTVGGMGTYRHIARWDIFGTGIQDSLCVIDDIGTLSMQYGAVIHDFTVNGVTYSTLFTSQITVNDGSGAGSNGFITFTRSGDPDPHPPYFVKSSAYDSLLLLNSQGISGEGTGSLKLGNITSTGVIEMFGGMDLRFGTGTFYWGPGTPINCSGGDFAFTGTFGVGARAVNGLVVTAGATGPFATLGANTFTGKQTISTSTTPALDVQQTSSNSSNTIVGRNISGAVTFAVTGDGHVSGVLDGGTW